MFHTCDVLGSDDSDGVKNLKNEQFTIFFFLYNNLSFVQPFV